jgi:hypothetical protein
MSANRSVQAAQRRRAGGPEPAAPGRGPQPSINSSQMFTGQPQHPANGRLAGQQASLQQQHIQQQRQQQMQQQQGGADSSVSKISIAQAITLITLRLGKVELQLYELGNQMASGAGHHFSSGAEGIEGAEGMVLIDQTLIDSIMSRLESLEKRSTTNAVGVGGGSSSAEVTLLKQQFEAIKPSIAQNTKVATALTKEQKEHKLLVDTLKSELAETKELLAALQAMSMDNSQKIFELMSGEQLTTDDNLDEGDLEVDDVVSEEVDGEELVISGNSLKGLIEQELNA